MTKSFSTLPLRVNADRMPDSFIHQALIGATGMAGYSKIEKFPWQTGSHEKFQPEI